MVTTLLYLMFSTDGDQSVHREAFFGSLFFEAEEKSDGATALTAGVAHPTALLVTFAALALALTAARAQLRRRRAKRRRAAPAAQRT